MYDSKGDICDFSELPFMEEGHRPAYSLGIYTEIEADQCDHSVHCYGSGSNMTHKLTTKLTIGLASDLTSTLTRKLYHSMCRVVSDWRIGHRFDQ